MPCRTQTQAPGYPRHLKQGESICRHDTSQRSSRCPSGHSQHCPHPAAADYTPGSLVTHLQLDETNTAALTAVDSSGNGNTGELYERTIISSLTDGAGPTIITDGPVINSVTKNGADFDGVNDLLTAASSASLDFDKTKGTISFWIRTDLTARRSIFRMYKGGAPVGPSIEQTGSTASAAYRIFFSPNIGASGLYMAEAQPVANTWTHFVFVWDYTQADSGVPANPNRVKAYVNGVATTNRTTSGGTGDLTYGSPSTETGAGIVMGARLNDDDSTTRRFMDRDLAEVAIFDEALAPAAVAALYSTGVSTSDPDLMAYWDLSEGVGATVFADDSPNGNTLKCQQVTYVTTPSPFHTYSQAQGPEWLVANANGKPAFITRALDLDGTTDLLRVYDSASMDFDKSQGTITLWAYMNTTSRAGIIGTENASLVAQISGSANMAFLPPGGATDFITTASSVTAGVWSHFAFVWDVTASPITSTMPNRVKIFRDGVQLAGTSYNDATGFAAAGTTSDWVVGRRHLLTDTVAANQRHLSGQLADLAIFSTALPQADIQYIKDNGVQAFLATDVADWTMLDEN
jgi:hypothetical protein